MWNTTLYPVHPELGDITALTLLASDHITNTTKMPQDICTCREFIFVAVGIIGSLAAGIGLIANVLSLRVIYKIGGGSITFLLLGTLAAVDTVHLLGFILSNSYFDIVVYARDLTEMHPASVYAMYIMYPITYMAQDCSVWITTLVTVYRYIAARAVFVQTRLFTRNKVYIQIILIFALSLALEIPKYFERKPSTKNITEACSVMLESTELWENDLYQKIFKTAIRMSLVRWIPIIITIIFAYKRFQLLQSWRTFRRNSLQKDYIPYNQEVISRVLVLLAVVFVIFTLPSSIYPIIRQIDDVHYGVNYYIYFYETADLLMIINSAFNVVIIFPLIPQYRTAMRELFSCCICRRDSSDEFDDTRRFSIVSQLSVISAQIKERRRSSGGSTNSVQTREPAKRSVSVDTVNCSFNANDL